MTVLANLHVGYCDLVRGMRKVWYDMVAVSMCDFAGLSANVYGCVHFRETTKTSSLLMRFTSWSLGTHVHV